jgi:hypothetical protein
LNLVWIFMFSRKDVCHRSQRSQEHTTREMVVWSQSSLHDEHMLVNSADKTSAVIAQKQLTPRVNVPATF